MQLVALFLCAALAGTPDPTPTTAQSLQDFHRSVSDLEVLGDLYRRVGDRPIRIVDGPLTVQLDSGWLVPIFSGRFSGEWEQEARAILRKMRNQDPGAQLPAAELRGDKQLVGFVWVGEGTARVTLEDRADALVFGNRMVADLGYEKADFVEIAHGRAPFDTTVTEGIFLSIDPKLEEAFVADGGTPDPFEVVIYADKGGEAAARQAEALWKERRAMLSELAREQLLRAPVGDWIAWDRLAELRGIGDATGAHAWFDLHTGHRYGLVQLGDVGKSSSGDQWLTLLRDDSGELDVRRRSQLLSIGRTTGGVVQLGRIGGEVFPPAPGDPYMHPAPPVRFEPDHADAKVLVRPTDNGLDLAVEMESTLRLKAVGGTLQWATLVFPRVEAVPNSWELLSATTADGRKIVGDRPLIEEVGEAADDDGDGADPTPTPDPEPEPEPEPKPERIPEDPTVRVRFLLPEPVPAGETVEIVVKTRDTWPYANWQPCGRYIAERPMGASSGLQSYLPGLGNGFAGDPWRIRTAVGVPDGSGLVPAISGDTVGTRLEYGVVWTDAEHTASAAMWPDVAVGKWKHNLDEPSRQDFPAIRVHLHTNRDNTIATFPPEARRVIEYYQRWLPPFPWSELEVFEAPMGCSGYTWIAPHAMVNVQRMVVADGNLAGSVEHDQPHLEHGTFAHEIAHQYWGHVARPANTEDFWIAETFAETFACMYVGAAFGPKDCDVRLKTARERWERKYTDRWAHASLPGAYESAYRGDIVYQYGPYVMLEMLRPRIGIEPFHAALDVMLRDFPQQPITTERLQRYFELAAEKDLSDFFAFWIHQGRIPSLDLTWTQGGDGRVTGTVTSDVPFGRIDVPVQITHKDGETWVVVDVVDGAGELATDKLPKGAKVTLDPAGRVLAKARRERRL